MGLDKKDIVNLVYVHITSLNVAILAEEKLYFDGNTFEGQYSSISKTGADPGGGPGGPGPPLTLGFEAPKLSIFGPYLIFP